MSYKLKLSCGLLFGIVFSQSAFSLVPPQPVVSEKNVKFYKDNVGKCRNFKDTAYMADFYINMLSGTKNVYVDEAFLSSFLGCDQKFIKDFKKMIANDNVEYHKYSRNKIKEEIKSFEDRGLTGNYMVRKYMDYAKNNDVDLEVDREMAKTYSTKKEEAKKRKESCSDKMNLKEPLSVDRPRNQDTIGWCYAFTAADLISHALGKEVSAAYVATRYNNKFWTRLLRRKEAGFADEAAKELISNGGVCLEKDMPSSDYRFSRENAHLGSLFKEVKALNTKYSPKESTRITPDKKREAPVQGYSKHQVYADLCTQNQETLIQLAEVFPHLNLNQLAEALMKSGDNAFSDLAETCPLDLDPKLKTLEVKTVFNSKKIYSTIDEQLEKGNIVGIAYRSNVLIAYKNPEEDADHGSSIVGRRFNEKTLSCEYLLRNAWGTSCANYGSEYECKNGHAWVGEEFFKFNKAITRVDYVETK